MGDEVPDVNTHIYQEQYFACDDEDGTGDFDFPDNDTLNDGGFEIGESSNPNLGQPHDTHDYVSPGGTLYWTPIVLDDIKPKEENVPSFTFEYKVLNKRLNALLWADETTKYNYNSFGDVVSLDATLSMNKYDMVFVPFTGIDNHKKCVTFGAGLLSKEDGVSYEWLLRDFLRAFRKQPQLVKSDQDPTLKKAINTVFPSAHHRLCMWHITKKFPNKEFKITDNSWMNLMYGLRRYWIAAFFKHIPMSGLMRTTSPSESQNWSFQTTTLTGSYLIMFMMTFDSVMERQIHNQILNDFNTVTAFPKFITCSPNEPHASKVTHSTKDGSFKCTCMHFEHVGILCRHIFCVFKYYDIEQLPEKYILKRWRREVIPTKLLRRRFTKSFDDSNSDMTAINILNTVDCCVSFLCHDATKLKLYIDEHNKLKKFLLMIVQIMKYRPYRTFQQASRRGSS
ncbi:unnamed protein product [Lactuca saligna]|uniref:SWIM-type domain-containing protein n=1 Tax=Lactuca saligna TaxID=75948 RepID=A0AA35ZXQ1_LACSI|nr:unnamed protein product [Lactuca saligna]